MPSHVSPASRQSKPRRGPQEWNATFWSLQGNLLLLYPNKELYLRVSGRPLRVAGGGVEGKHEIFVSSQWPPRFPRDPPQSQTPTQGRKTIKLKADMHITEVAEKVRG